MLPDPWAGPSLEEERTYKGASRVRKTFPSRGEEKEEEGRRRKKRGGQGLRTEAFNLWVLIKKGWS